MEGLLLPIHIQRIRLQIHLFLDGQDNSRPLVILISHVPPSSLKATALPDTLNSQAGTEHNPETCKKLLRQIALKRECHRGPIKRADDASQPEQDDFRQRVNACFAMRVKTPTRASE